MKSLIIRQNYDIIVTVKIKKNNIKEFFYDRKKIEKIKQI